MPWRDLASQPLACDLIARALRNGRIHHSYLMVGEDSETEPVALGFAQALNCEKNDGDFCGRCGSCRAIADGKHPDAYRIRPESRSRRIIIDQVRELERAIFLKANRARAKVAIIQSADRLQDQAQDAFLKTLEEPPPQTVLLLLTEEPQLLRDTILSRCLRISFLPAKRKAKTEQEQKVEAWLAELTSAASPAPPVFRAYTFAGRILAMLREVRDEKLEQSEKLLDDPSFENLEASQRERWKDQLDAQAQAGYIRERARLLKTILQWYRERPGSSSGETISWDPRSVEILEKLAGRLNRNINESLAWEVAALQLAEF